MSDKGSNDSGKKSPSDDEMEQCKKSGGTRMNPHLRSMKQDVLYHLALSTHSSDLKEMFGDVKVSLRILRWTNPELSVIND